jgi:two-component system NarL family response regulator
MNTSEHVRILVADDHAIVRAGVISLLELEPGLRVVGNAENGLEAIRLYQELAPDVVLMDLRMPMCDGLCALRAIREYHQAAKVILLTTFDDEEDVFRGLEAGAKGYLLKDAAPGEFVQSIYTVLEGGKAISSRVVAQLANRVSVTELSPRESEVLQWMAEGLANKQISGKLGIALGTVKVHVANILVKLDAQSRSEAVAIAIRRGLIKLC